MIGTNKLGATVCTLHGTPPPDFADIVTDDTGLFYLRTIFQGILEVQFFYAHVCLGMTVLFTQQHPINFNTTYNICVC